MGGSDILMKLVPKFVSEGNYNQDVQRLGLDILSPSKRVETFLI